VIAGDVTGTTFSTSWSVVFSDGSECSDHGLPDLPSEVQGFALTQAYDRFVYFCGGKSSAGSELKMDKRSLVSILSTFYEHLLRQWIDADLTGTQHRAYSTKVEHNF